MASEGDNESEQMEHDGEQDDEQENEQENEQDDWEEEADNKGVDNEGDVEEAATSTSIDKDDDEDDDDKEEDRQVEDDEQEPDATVRAVSASSCHRRHQREQHAALLVIQHANTGLSHLDALFAPLMSISPSPSSTMTSFFSRIAVLNVQGNALRDLAPLALLAPSLRMLNAAENAIASLPPRAFWVQFTRLKLCFLAHNLLGPWADGSQDDNWLDALAGASALRWLTLAGNSVMTRPRARTAVVNKLRQLCALDELVVADSERVQFARTIRFAVDGCWGHCNVSI